MLCVDLCLFTLVAAYLASYTQGRKPLKTLLGKEATLIQGFGGGGGRQGRGVLKGFMVYMLINVWLFSKWSPMNALYEMWGNQGALILGPWWKKF